MNPQDMEQHLSHISTMWTMLYQAHRGTVGEASRARQLLLQRYLGAVYRYLFSAVRDANVADDLTQEFALRFIQGRFAQAERGQGRFRHYVKTALFHLVKDHYRKQGKGPHQVQLGQDDPVPAPDETQAADEAFRDSWRQELLSRAWKGLEGLQQQTGQPYHDVLRFRVDHPDLASGQIAEQLGARLGKPLTAAGVRQMLHRARERFADLLLEDVLHSLEEAGHCDLSAVEEELAELNLLKYCQAALQRRSDA
jgi:RNA polymerase sigma-70 factor (ECF subfamily)